MQTKTTMRYQLIPVRMATIQKRKTGVGKDVEKAAPWCTVGGNENAAIMENSTAIPQKI